MTSKNVRHALLLISIIFIGAILRFSGINWDQGHHLQPDERYISLVLSSLSQPKNLGEYLDPNHTPVSPYLSGFGAYIYGQLPLSTISFLSNYYNLTGYEKEYLLGRFLSASLDLISILLTFLLGRKVFNSKIGLIAAAFYAFAPLPIQYSHFMVTEIWLVTSWLVALLLTLEFKTQPSLLRAVVVGLAIGAALAVKANAAVLGIMALGLMMLPNKIVSRDFINFIRLEFKGLSYLIIAGAVAVLAFRFFQPTIFKQASWLDWSLRQDFQSAFKFQQMAISGQVMFPPQWQWVGTIKWWFPLKNLVLFGLGPIFGLLVLVGVVTVTISSIKKRNWIQVYLIFITLGYFLWQGGNFVKIMRYFLPFVPIYAILAAAAIDGITKLNRKLGETILAIGILTTMTWAVMFTKIYRVEQTRVTASRWIYKNIPSSATIAIEEWDDPLPLFLPGQNPSQYQVFQMAVYAPDDTEKRKKIEEWIGAADWIVLSSYRAKGTIGRLAKKFPLMSRFYQDLENGSLGFVQAAEFTSFPSFQIGSWRLEINDSSAEESFWVYDHPIVEIYKKK